MWASPEAAVVERERRIRTGLQQVLVADVELIEDRVTNQGLPLRPAMLHTLTTPGPALCDS